MDDQLSNIFSSLTLSDKPNINTEVISEIKSDEESEIKSDESEVKSDEESEIKSEKNTDEKSKNKEICENIISFFKNEENKQIMYDFFVFLNKIIKCFPPKKNENKFIYGKISEYAFRDLLINCGFPSTILGDDSYFDDFHSNYDKDTTFLFSYKTTKSKGNIRLINYHSNKKDYDISNKIVCIVNIELKSIYLFPLYILPPSYLLNKTDGLDISSKYIKYMRENHKSYIFNCIDTIPDKHYDEIFLGEMIYKMLLEK
jgi:hypothetical protein